jgi:predicted house-cleaning noncanonical NTP pyrophosphatase (MazG superfamily)
MKHDKLVRDRIIEIIESKGEKATWHIASDEEYELKLKEKLVEEAKEFAEDGSIEEMADIFEVITTLLAMNDWRIEDVIAIQKEKHAKRGGFENKVILEES